MPALRLNRRQSGHLFRLASLALAAGFLLAGCKAQQANMKLKTAKQKLGEAEAVSAEKYAGPVLQQAREAIDTANRSMESGDAGAALDSAKRGLELAEQALQQSKVQYATDMAGMAKQAVDVAVLNQGSTIDPVRFEKINATFNQINEARAKDNWDQMITLATQVINEVDLLLQSLKNEAERQMIAAQNGLTAMKAEGAGVYVPERVIEVTDLVNQVGVLIQEKRDYISARNVAENAARKAQEGIDATRREKGKEAMDQIEQLILAAIEEGAQIYQDQQLAEVNQLYDSLTADFEENNFERVLLSADVLKPKVENMVFNTKKKAAEARIENLARTIASLEEAGVEEYLEGRVNVLREMHTQARDLYANNTEADFDKIKTLSQDALIEEEKIRSAFDDLANDEIRKTRDSLDRAQAVFDRMQGIFLVQPVEGMSALDLQFENAKSALREELGAALNNARLNLEVARGRRQEGKYKGAILLAQEVSRSVEATLNEIYHVVAFNAVMELAARISAYEMDGAQLYAPVELARSKGLLEDTKSLIAQKDFRLAVTRAAETRAQMEIMVQKIAERATNAIEEANDALREARSSVTERYRAEDLNAAAQSLQNAQTALTAGQLRNAVELAGSATERARTAAREAARLAAEDELENARSRIKRAQDADANRYAGKEFDDAKRLIQSSEDLFTLGKFAEAREVAIAASDKANQAFYKLVNDADAAINEAKSAGGWDRNRAVLVRAIANNDEARRVIELGQYANSAALARGAEKDALSVARASKIQNYRDQIRRIEENLEAGRQQGLTLFQVDDFVGVNQRLVTLTDSFDQGGLSNYEYTMTELSKLEARLRNALDSTQRKVHQVVAEQNSVLERMVTEDNAMDYAAPLVERAKGNLKAAKLDFDRRLYKSSHTSLAQAISDIREIQRRRDQERYILRARSLFSRLDEAKSRFSGVVNLHPDMLKSLARGDRDRGLPVNLADVYSPNDFRKAVEALYAEATVITPPATEAKTHEEVIAALNDARLAAINFEKMAIFNQITQRETDSIIDAAYQMLKSSDARVANLQRKFAEDEVRYRRETASAGPVM